MISNEIQLFLDCFAGRGSWNSVPHIVEGVISVSNRICRIRSKANTAPCEAVSVDFWCALHLFETGRELGDSMEPRFRNCFCCVGGHIEAYRSRVVVVGARALLPIRFV